MRCGTKFFSSFKVRKIEYSMSGHQLGHGAVVKAVSSYCWRSGDRHLMDVVGLCENIRLASVDMRPNVFNVSCLGYRQTELVCVCGWKQKAFTRMNDLVPLCATYNIYKCQVGYLQMLFF